MVFSLVTTETVGRSPVPHPSVSKQSAGPWPRGAHCVDVFLSPQVMAVPPRPLQLLGILLIISLSSVRLTQAGAYYGIKPLPPQMPPQIPPQIPQYQPLGQQVPHMPLGKDGLSMGKEMPHMQYGKEYPHLPQYMKEIQPVPRMGKEAVPKKGKGNIILPSFKIAALQTPKL